jgi:hypothetical protein
VIKTGAGDWGAGLSPRGDLSPLAAIQAAYIFFNSLLGFSTCYHDPVANRTEPKTAGQLVRYIVVAVIALFLVWWLLRMYVL